MLVLTRLVAEAQALAGEDSCQLHGHRWKSFDGQACPHPDDVGDGVCSQAVYVCGRCGAYDYGEPGGPGAHDCATTCNFGGRQHYADVSAENP